jgi:membrane fusion protein (multidrug efflux system)
MPWYIFSVIFLLFIACSQPPSPTTTARTPSVHLVKTAIVSPQPLSTMAVYTGSLRARRFVRIFMQEGGRITHLPYYEGDSVKVNALLVQLDDALLKAELDKAIATHKYARLNVRRLQKLAKQHIVSSDELSRAQTELEIARAEALLLRTRSSYTKITAPFAGIVTTRLAEPGDVINANTHILSIIVPSSLVIDVHIPERLLSQLKRLDPASIQIDALGTQIYKGYISRIHPTIDSRTRFGRIEIVLRPLPKGTQEGQFCRVTLTRHISAQLTLPYSALRRDREGEYVFLVDANSKTQRQAVRSGRRLADRVEILDGLKKGQTVVIKGFLGLQARKTVQLVE